MHIQILKDLDNPPKIAMAADKIKKIINEVFKDTTKYSKIAIRHNFCPKTMKDFLHVTTFLKDLFYARSSRIDLTITGEFKSIIHDYVESPLRISRDKIDAVDSSKTEIVLIAPNPQEHLSEIKYIIMAYNEAVKNNYKPVVLFAEGLSTPKQYLDLLPVEILEIIEPATTANLMGYCKSPVLKGIYYNGDGCMNGLIMSNKSFVYYTDFDSLIGHNDLGGVTFVSASCVAFNYPFGYTIVEGLSAKHFMSGLTELAGEDIGLFGALVFGYVLYNDMAMPDAFLKAQTDPTYVELIDKNYSGNPLNAGLWAMAGIDVDNTFPVNNLTYGKMSSAAYAPGKQYNLYKNDMTVYSSEDREDYTQLALVNRNIYDQLGLGVIVVQDFNVDGTGNMFSWETPMFNVYNFYVCNKFTGSPMDTSIEMFNFMDPDIQPPKKYPVNSIKEVKSFINRWWIPYYS